MPGDAGGPGLEVTQGRSVRMQKRPFLNACGLARQGCHACLPCPGRMQGHAAALWLWAGKSPPLRALTLGEFHALLGCPGHAAASWLQAGKGKNLLATHVEHMFRNVGAWSPSGRSVRQYGFALCEFHSSLGMLTLMLWHSCSSSAMAKAALP
eukprot:scaffold78586_cov19-Tisochrysis_lutea.AAC.2